MRRQGSVVVVTPEHVEIALSPAGLGSRFLALTVDSLFTTLLPYLVYRLMPPILSPGASFALFVTVQFFFGFAYYLYFETRHQGRSIGKRALRLRVVDSRGLPITLAQSLVRNALRALDALPVAYGVGALAVLADRHGRRLGDLAAETLVVEEPSMVEYRGEGLSERRFNTLRTPKVLRLIRHRISLEERELLLELCMRSERLDPEKRYALMEQVASHYRAELDIEDPFLSGENLVRDLTSILFSRPALRKS